MIRGRRGRASDGGWARFCDALGAPARRERVVVAALVVYWLVWMAYGTITKAPQHLHTDMTELFAWSRNLALGYGKHPPLAAWLVRLWFSVFPVTEWSYYLLAMLMPVTALWIVWRLSADYLDDRKRVLGLAMLTLVPFFNFHALKFNVNTVLMPLWAAAIFFFLRSYRTRSACYAALAGAAAAACMLGKYWSVFLLGGLAIAALIDSRRAAYFRSAAPWISAAAGLVVMSPNLVWLAQNNFKPLLYAAGMYSHKTLADSAISGLDYLAGAFAYVLLPLVIVAATRPAVAALADTLWPADRERRLVAALFWAPLLLPPVVAVTSGTHINPLWSMSAWTLLPVLQLSSPAVTISAADTRRLLIGAAGLPLVVLLAAPAVAIITFRHGEIPYSAQGPLLTAQIERSWYAVTPRPLRFVGGDAGLSYGAEFYSKEWPRALPGLPQPDAAELARDGAAYVCFAEDDMCIPRMKGHIENIAISGGSAAQVGATRHYAISVVPPRQ